MKHLYWLILFAFSISLTDCTSTNQTNDSQKDKMTTIYLVRHAEKEKGDDPNLTLDGQKRAGQLSGMLKKVGLTHIYSSDYNRTKQTAEPTAKTKRLVTEIYDARKLETIAEQIQKLPLGSKVLVVGHSNTTPVLTNLLDSNAEYKKIDESDYENIFVVEVNKNGVTKSQQQLYSTFQRILQ